MTRRGSGQECQLVVGRAAPGDARPRGERRLGQPNAVTRPRLRRRLQDRVSCLQRDARIHYRCERLRKRSPVQSRALRPQGQLTRDDRRASRTRVATRRTRTPQRPQSKRRLGETSRGDTTSLRVASSRARGTIYASSSTFRCRMLPKTLLRTSTSPRWTGF